MTEISDANKAALKRKPARCQLDPSLVLENSKPDQTGEAFNIWYGKWTGGENNGQKGLVLAKYRCNVKLDSGYTKADRYVQQGQINRVKYICLYFARGYCCNGKNCEYLHRIPTGLDIFTPTVDCFGREKYMDYRDDMSGIGSFGKVNKTLYVGGIASMSGNIELRISKAFEEFGDLAYVNVLSGKNVAFVSYKLESQAQFAKEAMYCQSLEPGNDNEILNIRWANEDPSFRAKKRQRAEDEEMTMEAARKLLWHLQKEKSDKVQDTGAKDGGKNQLENKENNKQENQKVRVDIESLDKLARLKSQNTDKGINNVKGLVGGYSSSDDDDD